MSNNWEVQGVEVENLNFKEEVGSSEFLAPENEGVKKEDAMNQEIAAAALGKRPGVLKRYAGMIASVLGMSLLMGGVGYWNYKKTELMNINAGHVDVAGYSSDAFYKITLNTHYLESDLNRIVRDGLAKNNEVPKLNDNKQLQSILANLKAEAANIQTLLGLLRNGGNFDKGGGEIVEIQPLKSEEAEKALTDAEVLWREYSRLLAEGQQADLDTVEGLATMERLVNFSRENQVKIYDTLDIIVSGLTVDNIGHKNMISNVLMAAAASLLLFLVFFLLIVVRRMAKNDVEIDKNREQLALSFNELSKTHHELSLSQSKLTSTLHDLEASKKNVSNIMNTVQLGLGLISQNLTMREGFSKYLAEMLGNRPSQPLVGMSLPQILSEIIADKSILPSVNEYLKSLFMPHVVEEYTQSLNPLLNVEVYLPNPVTGQKELRHLSFNFRRVMGQNVKPGHIDPSKPMMIENILMSIQDITAEMELKDRLDQEKAEKAMQLEMFEQVSKISQSSRLKFLNSLKEKSAVINEILRREGYESGHFRAKVNEIFTLVHSVKGESALLGFTLLQRICHRMEENLNELKNRPSLMGDDFLQLTNELDRLMILINTLEKIIQLGNIQAEVQAEQIQKNTAEESPVGDPEEWKEFQTSLSEPKPTDPQAGKEVAVENKGPDWLTENPPRENEASSELLQLSQQLYDFAKSISLRQEKQVELTTVGFDGKQLSEAEFSAIKDVCVQFLRNSISHGIEMPEERMAAGKDKTGKLKFELKSEPGKWLLSFSDDGRGIQTEKIRRKAVEIGRLNEKDAGLVDERGLVAMIFEDGFSTADKADEDAGRGHGMSVVRQVVLNFKGNLQYNTKPGRGVTFILHLPAGKL